jgi:hypothetical protein
MGMVEELSQSKPYAPARDDHVVRHHCECRNLATRPLFLDEKLCTDIGRPAHNYEKCHAPGNDGGRSLPTLLVEIIPQKQLHDMLRSSAFDVSQIAFPCAASIGALHYFVTWKVIYIRVRGGPLLGECS